MLEFWHMTAIKKRRYPANDPRPLKAQRMSYVSLPRPYWTGQRVVILAVLAIFVLILGIVIAANFPPSHVTPPVAVVAKQAEPFDIRLGASELAPPDAAALLAQKLPPHVLISKSTMHQNALPPVLEVTVEGDGVEGADAGDNAIRAAHQAVAAQNLMRQNDVRQALQFQHRAVELAPDNMLYRRDLAIMHDRVGDKGGAATLYRQVVQAYDAHDKTLPLDLGIDDIRHRLDYLTASSAASVARASE